MTSQRTAEFGSAASSVKPIDSHARFIIVGVIVVGSFIALLNQTVMSPALPALMRDFNITTGTVQWVTSVYMLVSGIMVPISGYLIDKFSTRKLFAGALATFMVGTLLCAVAPNFVLLLIGRVLQSAGSGVLLPLVAVVPMLVYPPDKRGTAMGMAGIVMAAGPAIGPVVGGLVIDSFGWRPMFIGIAVVALVILVGGTMMLKNVGELKNPKLNILSVILSTIAFGGLLYGFSSASTMGWASPVVITSIVVGLVAFVAFVYKQVKLDEPLLRVDTLATRNFRNSAILVTLINAAVAATNVTLPIFIQNVLGQSATVTGMVMLPAAAVGIILSPVAGAAFDKFGPRGVGIGVPNEFNRGLNNRTAIYTPFAQAIPNVPVIDRENCLKFKTGKCGVCSKVCQAGAIDYDQQDEIVTQKYGAIVVATGFDTIKLDKYDEYAYSQSKDVITSLELERIMNAAGPTKGHLERLSDGKAPKELVFIQCVGSRCSDDRGKPYCSKICCMYTAKHAMLIRDKYPDTNVTVFYIDVRTPGKNFDEFYRRAVEDYGVMQLVKCCVC